MLISLYGSYFLDIYRPLKSAAQRLRLRSLSVVDLILSRPFSRTSTTPPLVKFAHSSLLETVVWLNPPQEFPALKNKVELLLLHVDSLEKIFSTPPNDDVPEMDRRDKLILYVTISLVYSVLICL